MITYDFPLESSATSTWTGDPIVRVTPEWDWTWLTPHFGALADFLRTFRDGFVFVLVIFVLLSKVIWSGIVVESGLVSMRNDSAERNGKFSMFDELLIDRFEFSLSEFLECLRDPATFSLSFVCCSSTYLFFCDDWSWRFICNINKFLLDAVSFLKCCFFFKYT